MDHLTDPLDGPVPTWRIDAEDDPIYRALVAELGRPGSLLGPAPSAVVPGEVVADAPVEAPPTVPIPIRPTVAIPTGAAKKRRPSARRAS